MVMSRNSIKTRWNSIH